MGTILVETIVIGAFYFLLRCEGFEVTQPPQVSVSGYGSASIRCEVTAMSANQQVDDVRLNRVQDQQVAVLCQRGQGSDCVDSVWYQESTSCHVFVLLRLDGKELQGDRYECEVTTRQDKPRLLYETRKGRPTRLLPPGPTRLLPHGPTALIPEIQEVTSSPPLRLPVPSSSSVTPLPLPVLTWILIGLLAVMSLYSGAVSFMYIRLRVTRGEELYDRLTYMPMVRGHLPLNSTYEDMRPHPQRGPPPISSPSG